MDDQVRTFPTPVDWDQLYPGRFLKAGEFNGKKPTLTITKVSLDELEGTKGKQIKGLITFKEVERQLALNRTNGVCIKAMFGRQLADWVGKRITLFAHPYEGDVCIRIWGSPDIEKDFEAKVELPRKRPFNMTMHKVLPKGASNISQETSDGQ